MRTARNVRIAAILALLVVLAAGYRWWVSPERQIRAMLDDVAAAFTHEEPDSGLEALSAVAALQEHLAADVTLEGPEGTRITGRQDVISAAARIRAGGPAMRVRFFDPAIELAGERAATVSVTAEITTTNGSGDAVVDVQEVMATLERPQGQWLVSHAQATRSGEAQP